MLDAGVAHAQMTALFTGVSAGKHAGPRLAQAAGMSGGLLATLLEPGRLTTLFQPIFELGTGRERPYAVECFTHGPVGTNLEPPHVLFEYARRKHAESAVDRACIATALRAARALPGEPRITLNVHAATLGRDHEFTVALGDLADVCGIALDRLVIEVTEPVLRWDRSTFLNTLKGLRDTGVEIALDDFGVGHANLGLLLELRPNYLKAHETLVEGCSRDPHRQAIVEMIVGLASHFGARVVAEGVETASDLAMVSRLGVTLAQGWLLGRPGPASGLQSAPGGAGGELEEVDRN